MANLQKMNKNIIHKTFSQEFSELFGYSDSFVNTDTIFENLDKNIVDKSYLEALILVGDYYNWHKTIHLPFDNFAKNFYGDFIKIFYHLHDPHFDISHFELKYPKIAERIIKKFDSYRKMEIFCDENICVK